jgi:hypothetical protein
VSTMSPSSFGFFLPIPSPPFSPSFEIHRIRQKILFPEVIPRSGICAAGIL